MMSTKKMASRRGLTKLVAINFQGLTRLELVLDAGITTLVGPTDAGKSSVIRLLRWLATNRPLGEGFIRRGADYAVGWLEVDGKRVVRKKGKGKNFYSIDGRRMVALKSDVPPDVAHLLNLGPVNFQGQHDAPFWLAASGGEVSRQLNEVVNLGLIDRTLAQATHELRDAEARVRVSQERLAQAQRTADDLAWVPALMEAWHKLGVAREASEGVRTRRSRLEDLLEEGGLAQKRLDVAANARLALANRVLAAREGLALSQKVRRLGELLTDYAQQEAQQCEAEARLKSVQKRLGKVKRCPVCQGLIKSSPS